MAGLHLDPWQQFVLTHALSEDKDGQWAAFEVGVEVARQNGKGGLLEARELAGLFILGEELIIHSAHEFATAIEAFRRLESLIQNTPDLHSQVKPKGYKHSHGEEGIEFKSGQRIRFRTRTKGGTRGFTCDCLILDEAMVIPEAIHGAVLPTVSAVENPQVWYTGSAVDQEVMEHGLVFARVRDRAINGVTDEHGERHNDPSLAYFGWSADAEDPELVGERATDAEQWARANPGLGIRISLEHVAREQRSMDPRTFAVERLGVGDWPAPDEIVPGGIPLDGWLALQDPSSQMVGPVCFAFDVRPDRSAASIGVAGLRADGLSHVEVIEHRPGTGWVGGRLGELTATHEHSSVVYGLSSPAAALVKDGKVDGVVVSGRSTAESAEASGAIFDAVDQGTLRHPGHPGLLAAVKGAAKRPAGSAGEAWTWSRTRSTVDISPLVAVTLALSGLGKAPRRRKRAAASF